MSPGMTTAFDQAWGTRDANSRWKLAVTKSTNHAPTPPAVGGLTSPAGPLVPNVLSYVPASLLQSTVMNRFVDMYCGSAMPEMIATASGAEEWVLQYGS